MGKTIASFLMGGLFTLFFIIIAQVNVDSNFDFSIKKLVFIQDACKIANSTPKSYDDNTITCNNGAILKYYYSGNKGWEIVNE